MKDYKLSRSDFLRLSGITAVGAVLSACGTAPARKLPAESAVVTADQAIDRLLKGNQRYVTGKPLYPNQSETRRTDIAKGQKPFATILGCIDSRVPAEIIFDRGLGDIFVVRTAGHVLDNAVLGSLQFTVEEAGVPLIVVLGHERCGAVNAAVKVVEENEHAPAHMQTLVDGIKPAIERAKSMVGDKIGNIVRSNVELTVTALKSTPIIGETVAAGKLKIIGAHYDLDSGEVQIVVA